LTECGDLSEAEAEETEMTVVAEALEMAVVTITMAVLTVKTAVTLRMAETMEET
jgi:hypothetical protein